jgi:hypothetical protein
MNTGSADRYFLLMGGSGFHVFSVLAEKYTTHNKDNMTNAAMMRMTVIVFGVWRYFGVIVAEPALFWRFLVRRNFLHQKSLLASTNLT